LRFVTALPLRFRYNLPALPTKLETPMRCALAIPICVLALLPVVAQQPQQPQQPTFRAGVDVVAVDVHVVDGAGRPVPDLRPDEFTITVDGKPRTIVAADYVSHGLNTSAAPAAPAKPRPIFTSNWIGRPAAPARTIIIVVDHENIASGNGRAAVDAIGRFLNQVQPNDRVGLALLTRGSVTIDPTTDRTVIRQALPAIIGRQTPADGGNPYSLGQAEAFALLHNEKEWGSVLARECSSRYSGARLQACLAEMETYARSIIADSRRRQVDSMRALVALFNSLAQLPGPKTVVLISQQLPVAPYLPERSDFNAEARPLAQAAARASANVYVLHLDLPRTDVERAREPGNVQADFDMASFGLETVTSVTGGRRMMVSGKPEGAFDRLSLEISAYYLLGFRSEPSDRDGKPHQIKVTVSRKGVDLRARQMFAYAGNAATPDKDATESVNRMLRAATTETGIPMSVATYSLMDPVSGAPQMRVLITAEIERAATKDTPLTVGYTLTDSAGRNAGAAVEQITLKPAMGHPDGPLVYTAAALVPPGSYALRVAAADSALRLGSVVHDFEARVTDAGIARLSDLVVFDPYVAETGKPRPSVSATSVGELSCYLEAYTGGQAQDKVTVRLELADGVDSAPRASAMLDVQPADNGGRMRISGAVPLRDVPPGDYIARAVFLANGTAVGRVVRPVRVTSSVRPVPTTPAPRADQGPPATVAPPQPAQPPVAAVARPAEPAPSAAPASVKHTTPAVNVDELMPRVASYIRNYTEQMSLVIGVEHYSQWLQREDFTNPSAGTSRAISKQLVAEFALVRNKDDWDGFRNVYEVDGKPVPEAKDRMINLFTREPATAVEQSRKIAAESSRYNLGAIQRNFNVPTVALFFLAAPNQGRFRFTKDKDDDIGGVKVWKVRFEETRKPTIIRTSAGNDMPVKGEAWIDAVDGRVLKTHMQLDSRIGRRGADTTASITVTYALDPRLQILVPSEMLETYEAPMRSAFTGEDNMTKVNCRATYSDFKRFETSGRVLPPK
jgi:VWFA-related protein